MADQWLPTLLTATPEDGFELAVELSRRAVARTQSSPDIRQQLRAAYDHDPAHLIAASHVVAVNFGTIAAANGWWQRP